MCMQAYKSADCAFGTLTPYLALMYTISDYSFPNRVSLCLRKSGPFALLYLEMYAAKCNHFGYTSLFDSYTT